MGLAQLESLSQAATGQLLEHEQQYVITACAVSQGYREFKREDGYDDPVMAVVYHVLGPVQKNITDTKALLAAKRPASADTQANYAIFSCGSQFYALEGIHIHEAVSANALLPIASDSCTHRVGMLSYQNQAGRQMVWVYDLAALLGETRKASAETRAREIIILKTPRGPAGLLLNALHTVGRYNTHPLMAGSFTEHSLIQEVLHVSDQVMVPVLNLSNLLAHLQTPTHIHPA